MKRHLALGFGLLVLGFICFITSSVLAARFLDKHSFEPIGSDGSYYLVNVNLIPISTRGVVDHQQLQINDGKITSIRPSGTLISDESRVINAHGAYALPGLFDMHVHIDDRQQLRLALSYGVTTVRNMDGMPAHLRWKKELSRGDWLGANLYSTSPAVHGESHSSVFDIVVRDKESATSLVSRFKKEGWDQIKIYSGLGKAEYKAILNQAKKLGIDVVGHVPYAIVETNYKLASGMRTIEHVEEIFQGPLKHKFSLEKLSQVARELYSMRAVVCPTLSTFEHLTRISEEKESFVETLPTKYMTPFGQKFQQLFDIDRWLGVNKQQAVYNNRELKFLKQVVKKLDDEGVELIVGTDSGTNFVLPGISMRRELQLMYESGLDTQTILETATVNSARALRLDARLGTLEEGKQADLVLYADNPLEDISVIGKPLMVIKNGELLDQKDLAKFKREAKDVAGWWISTGRYLEAFLMRI